MKPINIPVSAQLTIEEYLTERQMSKLPVLLVEGNDDDIAFQLLRDEILNHSDDQTPELIELLQRLEIDTPANISSPTDESLGNRSKVERICYLADTEPFQGLLVGFVDREFREFEFTDKIVDKLTGHNQIGRIVWSRGHSIENYFFAWSILRDCLRDYGINSAFHIQEALELLENNFTLMVNYASAISLAASDTDLINSIQRSFDQNMFSFENDVLEIDLKEWDALLHKNQRLDESRRSSLLTAYREYLAIVEATSTLTVRWICHGHIGMNFIWAVFQSSIYRICEQKQILDPRRLIRHPSERDRLITFLVAWIKNGLIYRDDSQDTPLLCFDMLLLQQAEIQK